MFSEKKWNKVPSKIYSLIDCCPLGTLIADTSVVDLSKPVGHLKMKIKV